MRQAQLHPLSGTYSDQFKVLADEEALAVIAWEHLEKIVTQQLAAKAPASIPLAGGCLALTVYERRTLEGVASSEDGLRLEIGERRIRLTSKAARDLSCVLLAYAGQENRRGQWLLRMESGQG